MPKSNSFYLCLFVLCYLQNIGCSERQLYKHENVVNSSADIREKFSTNRQSFHSPSVINKCLKDATVKTIPVDSVTSRLDFGVGSKIPFVCYLVLRSTNYYEKHFGFTTNQPLLSSSVKGSEDGPAKGPYQYIGSTYDVAPGIIELCRKDDECSDQGNSFCGPPTEGNVYGKCECKINYIDDGEKCVEKEDVRLCYTHDDCGGNEKGRCVFHLTTKRKICKCEWNFVAAKRQCLPKVQYLGDCISSKQCSMDMQCLKNICRQSCNDGYSWKHDTCMKDHPDIKPSGNISNNEIFIWHIIAPISIICGVTVVVLLITLTIIIRRRFLERSDADNPQDVRSESSSSHFDQICDQPPSYDEVTTNSTLTLIQNAENIAEDPPPSYTSWEEGYSDNSASKR